jgi:hypothetical protein
MTMTSYVGLRDVETGVDGLRMEARGRGRWSPEEAFACPIHGCEKYSFNCVSGMVYRRMERGLKHELRYAYNRGDINEE